jgi:beta-glucosidase
VEEGLGQTVGRAVASKSARTLRLALASALLVLLASAVAAQAAGRCGSHPWCDTSLGPDKRAELLLKALTPEERIGLLAGDEFTGVAGQDPHGHTGTSDGVPRVGLPTTYYTDGPVGPRQGNATAMPVPLALGATFSPELARRYGDVVANEAKSKGNDVMYAPTVNIMRTPLNGRTFESYGEDPFLMTRLGVEYVRATQAQGVIADIKHYAANNQEGADPSGRTGMPGSPLGAGAEGDRYVVNEHIDERTLREIYLPHFEAAVKEANVASVMCAYQRVNGRYACESPHLLQEILEGEWGFKGFVLADYGAAHNAGVSLNSGLDFEPWPAAAYGPAQVHAALASGQATQAQVDKAIRRVLRTEFAYGFFDRPAYRDDDAQIDKAAHARTAREVEESAIVLLKNSGGALPLDAGRLKSIALIGAGADGFTTGGGSGNVKPFSFTSPLQAIQKRVGAGVQVRHEDGSDPDAAADAAKASDVAIVIPADYLTEGADRPCLTLECPDAHGDQDGLIERVAAANPNTIVVLETGGPVLTPWRDRVRALLEAWYPGQEGGTAIARVLFGDVDPGGRLPGTFPRSEDDLPTAGDPEKYPGVNNEVFYKEGVLVGYRWYDSRGIAPAFTFGFGLSYTSFAYRNLRVEPAGGARLGAKVSLDVANTGERTGSDVPQVYLGLPQPAAGVVQPPRQLKGFRKLELAPGKSKRVSFALDTRALSYWHVGSNGWRVAPGCYSLAVGRSSRDIALRRTLAVSGASCGAGAVKVPGKCRKRPRASIRIKGVRPSRVRRVTVYVNGRRRKVLIGPRARVRVKVAKKGTTRVRLTIRTRRHRTLHMKRKLRYCAG